MVVRKRRIVAIEDSNSKCLGGNNKQKEEIDWTKDMEIDAEPMHFGQDGLGDFDWSNTADDTPVSLALMAIQNAEVPYWFQNGIKVVNQENTKTSQPEIDRNKVIIEDWVDSDDEETALNFSEIQKKTVLNSENSETSFENKSPNSQNSVGQGSRKKGLGHKGVKTCFVFSSPDYLIKDVTYTKEPSNKPKTKEPKERRCGLHGSMTGDKDKLSDFKEFKGGYVAFGNDPKGGRITGKGTIKTSCIDFEKTPFTNQFWAEAAILHVTILNRGFGTKPQKKLLNEILMGRSPNISFMRPFLDVLRPILNSPRSIGNKHYMYELLSLMHQESIAKVHNDAQRNAFEEEKRRIALEKGKESANGQHSLPSSDLNLPHTSGMETFTDDDHMRNLSDSNDDVSKNGVFPTNSFDDENTNNEEDGAPDYNNMDHTLSQHLLLLFKIHKNHPQSQIIGKSTAGVLTRRKLKESASDQHQALLSFMYKQNQLLDYGFNFMNTEIHIDNESTICIMKNPVLHSRLTYSIHITLSEIIMSRVSLMWSRYILMAMSMISHQSV
ncbi:hypothetical protein Tco_1276212 [Tanacetum coccineum]